MRQLLRLAVILTLACFCGAALADGKTDAELRTKIVGRWQELREFECERHQQVMQMRANGTFEVQGVIRTCEGTRSFVWKGTWRVKDGKLGYKTTASDPPGEFAVGEAWDDEILSVSTTEWVMREQSTGKESHAFRLK